MEGVLEDLVPKEEGHLLPRVDGILVVEAQAQPHLLEVGTWAVALAVSAAALAP